MKSMRDYYSVFNKLSQNLIRESDFTSKETLEELFGSNEKVVTILNHSTPLSWLPAISLLIQKIYEAGGAERVPVGVMDKFFFRSPFLQPVAKYVTQFNQFPTFDEILKKTKSEYTDVAIFPEGSNCFFGQGEVIQPFRSPRFVELALKMKSKIFLVVHRGSEDWAHTIDLKHHKFPFQAYLPGWLNEKIQRGGFFVVPKFPQKIPKFQMQCEFYEPSLKIEDLSQHRADRMSQLWGEAERVRSRMQEMFDELESAA